MCCRLLLELHTYLCETLGMATDEIQRQFWQYRRVWLGIIALLIAGKIILPRIPILKGWEQKFANASVELGKVDLPTGAARVSSTEEALKALAPQVIASKNMADVIGPIMVGAWKCSPMGLSGGCIRYLWQGESVTLVISTVPKNVKVMAGPFTKNGWGGQFIVTKDLAFTIVGPFASSDLVELWPFSKEFKP